MGKTVRQLDMEIGSDEYAMWIAYNRLEPWGEERADLRSGIVAATVANQNIGKKQKPFSAAQFMPRFRARTPDDPAKMEAIMCQIAAKQNREAD